MSTKIKIIKNPEISLDIPQFCCDKDILGDHLNDHPLTALLNIYGFTCMMGKPQQGKTSLAVAFITQSKPRIFKKTHHNILIMMPLASISSMKKNPFEMLPPENFYHEFNESTIEHVRERLLDNSSKNLKTLLFIDDMTAHLKASKMVQTILKDIVYNRRHYKCNIIITVQSYVNMPLDIRKLITNLFMFKPSKVEMELLFSELFESKKEKFMDVMKAAFPIQSKNAFLLLNVTSQRMFTNFDEMIFEEDEDDLITFEK